MEKHMQARVILSPAARKTVAMDVYRRSKIEACGVLLGTMDEGGNWSIEQAHPLENIYASPVYFEFDPEELLTVDLAYPGQVVGVYHSHPTGFAMASSTDRQNMQRVNQEQQIPWVWLIIPGPFAGATGAKHKGRRNLAGQTSSFAGELAQDRVIAYHHYDKEGLQRVTVEFVEESMVTQDDTSSSSINS
jgi:proteasome lid subunit RPN8/RPN11